MRRNDSNDSERLETTRSEQLTRTNSDSADLESTAVVRVGPSQPQNQPCGRPCGPAFLTRRPSHRLSRRVALAAPQQGSEARRQGRPGRLREAGGEVSPGHWGRRRPSAGSLRTARTSHGHPILSESIRVYPSLSESVRVHPRTSADTRCPAAARALGCVISPPPRARAERCGGSVARQGHQVTPPRGGDGDSVVDANETAATKTQGA